MSNKVLTVGENAADLRDVCIFLFGLLDGLGEKKADDVRESGQHVDLSFLRKPIARLAESVVENGLFSNESADEWSNGGKWHRVASYVCGVIEAASPKISERFGFAVKITSGDWLWSSIMDAIFDEIAPLALMDDDEFVKFWAKRA